MDTAHYVKVTRLSCDFDCLRGRNKFRQYNRRVGPCNSRLLHIKGLFGKLRVFSNFSMSPRLILSSNRDNGYVLMKKCSFCGIAFQRFGLLFAET